MYQVDNLTAHSFTAKIQTQYLKKQKEEIDEETCIILLDLAENYHFIVQDEVQEYHWKKEQCTLHPVVIYYLDQNDVLHFVCLYFISDDLEHDTNFVNELQRLICQCIEKTIHKVKSIEYFSDGCSGQYKNIKNFESLPPQRRFQFQCQIVFLCY